MGGNCGITLMSYNCAYVGFPTSRCIQCFLLCVERLFLIGSHFSLRKWRRQPRFPTKLAAVASFSYKIGCGGLIFLQNWRRRRGGLSFLQNWRRRQRRQGFGNITGGYSDMVWILGIGNYREKCPLQIWKRYIATSSYRSFNFQHFFFYDIFLRNAYFTSYWSSNYKSIWQSILTHPLSASTWGQLKYLPYSFPYISILVYWYTFKNKNLWWHFIASSLSSFTLRLFIHEITSS